ncbi:hypothetical protein BG011_008270 [Mortierella polycephala]|uniref:Uncharacterized protein n=1 Tax=Mortierella polycephala TaxID=41804 RepID=A0A9P6PNA1_9FUNG|nr:hypothetical protein BG011_008270 [Mortierella polycephala]
MVKVGEYLKDYNEYVLAARFRKAATCNAVISAAATNRGTVEEQNLGMSRIIDTAGRVFLAVDPGSATATMPHSRLVFGYVSRLCPRLQDLTIKYNGMKMGLEDSHCVLSRFQDLHRHGKCP